ncbi:MAG: tetraacyldisaccharide 4'-kinase [Silicimonas sp.]|nr:tetraacyldisaccharide 4'-kinase [Silicimonas sp.]
MRPPGFWSNPPEHPGWQAHLLAPLAALYATATARRIAAPKFDPGPPVISVGNLNVGGTGKTPMVMDLVMRLGADTHVVTRGYGGSETGPLRVKEREHSADEVGDEPLLLSAFAPTWVARDRPRGLQAATRAGARVIVLDDGHQTRGVARALSILVVDAEAGFGNGRVIPSGPLREPVATGLHRTHLVVLIGPPEARARFRAKWGEALKMPVVEATLEVLETGMDWAGLPVLAFAGIGRPEKFFATLRGLGADLLRAEPLDDHQPLSEALMKRLELEAAALGAQLVTTEKDAVRLPAGFRQKVLTLPVRLRFENTGPLDRVIKERV